MLVRVTADHHLRMRIDQISSDLADFIADDLTILNEERQDLMFRNIQGWEDLPEYFHLVDIDDDGEHLIMPRGYKGRLVNLLRQQGYEVAVRDNHAWHKGSAYLGGHAKRITYRPHQPLAIKRMRQYKQGIYVAPTGSGKTVTMCGLLTEITPMRSLILVNRIDLVDQWIKRIHEHIGPAVAVGRIGEGKWSENRITVATLQTIWSRYEELEDDWWDSWDLVCLDECHHVTAETFNAVMANFSARYRFGMSATPSKTGQFELAQATLGNIFHEDDLDELVNLGVILKPSVITVPTDLQGNFYGDHEGKKHPDHPELGFQCNVGGCNQKRPHHRNNYSEVLQQLVADTSRAMTICDVIESERGNIQLIVTDQVKQIDAIIAVARIEHRDWFDEGIVHVITGKQTGKKRQAIIEAIEQSGEAICFTTVGAEGLDIPIINVVHVVFPTKNGDKIRQIIGRAMRTVAGKTQARVYDYFDQWTSVFNGQRRKRYKECYFKMGLEIVGEDEARKEAARDRMKSGELGSLVAARGGRTL